MKLLLLGGIGDIFCGTSFLDFSVVQEVYWATKVHVQFRPLFDIVFPDINHFLVHDAFSDNRKGYIMASHLPVKNYPKDVVEWSPAILPPTDPAGYHPSPLVQHQLADIDGFGLPPGYVVVQPYTLSQGGDRDFGRQDWANALEALGDRPGVVVDASWMNVPEDPRLINLQRQTSLPEAIEIVKQASGYIGIDSCFSILACQMRYPIQIRTTNTWYYACQHVYCAPRSDYNKFVTTLIRPDLLIP